MQDRRRRKKKRKRERRRSGGQDWKVWRRQTAPSWLRSEYMAWWSERSRVTAGKKEGSTKEAEGRERQTEKQVSEDIEKKKRA